MIPDEVPENTDNSVRENDGPQNVTQEPVPLIEGPVLGEDVVENE